MIIKHVFFCFFVLKNRKLFLKIIIKLILNFYKESRYKTKGNVMKKKGIIKEWGKEKYIGVKLIYT